MELLFKNFTHLTLSEHKQILALRNSDKIRNNMKATQVIKEDEHLTWAKKLQNDTTKFYVAVVLFDKVIGSINMVNIQNKKAHLGLYFSNKTNPLHVSLATLIFIEHVFIEYSLKKIIAEVLKSNEEALKFDKLLGFEEVGKLCEEGKEYTILELTKTKWHTNKTTKLYALTKKIDTINYNFI